MGQRLNITITKNGERLANAYYHWSAYSEASLQLAESIIKNLKLIQNTNFNDITKAIILLQFTNAGLTIDELEYAGNHLNDFEKNQELFHIAVNRNEGLIAISEEGMNETESYEEGRVTIDIGKNTFLWEVYSTYTRSELELDLEFEKETIKKAVITEFNVLQEIPIENFKDLLRDVYLAYNNGLLKIKDELDYILLIQ